MLIPLILVGIGTWFFVFRHPERRKKLSSFVPNNFRALLSKENRTALAIAIGAIAIVLALVFSNNQPQNAGNQIDQEYQFKLKKYETCMMKGMYSTYAAESGWCRRYAGLD